MSEIFKELVNFSETLAKITKEVYDKGYKNGYEAKSKEIEDWFDIPTIKRIERKVEYYFEPMSPKDIDL